MPALPALIVDLHTHFFNARSLPLAGVIAGWMGKEAGDSRFARCLARLLYRLTESKYLPEPLTPPGERETDYYVSAIAGITADELTEASTLALNESPRQGALQSDLYQIIAELEQSMQEPGEQPPDGLSVASQDDLPTWARSVVTKAMRKLEALPKLQSDIDNYVAFVFNMLTAETRMVATLTHAYGTGLPPLQFVHHMMDMQLAYVGKHTPAAMVEPFYPFATAQLSRMDDLRRQYDGRVSGFSAFDPRRPDWREIAERSLGMQFKGFKFYPAMGYRPIGNEDPVVEARVREFFMFCVDGDHPVFTHCTPKGFETREHKGYYADPRTWEKLLTSEDGKFAKLRLCFGHGGGGRFDFVDAQGVARQSPGWTATPEEWPHEDNYAATVARLCQTYDNVYCDLAYLEELFEGSAEGRAGAVRRFTANLVRELERRGPQERNWFQNKIAFGTDWHMPAMVEQPRRYLDVFLELFASGPLAAFREEFFWKNAHRFMNNRTD